MFCEFSQSETNCWQTYSFEKANNRLSLTFKKVKSVKKAKEVLEGVGE